MRRLITFCVLLLFSTLTESIPFLPEYQKEYPKQYQPALANTYTNFAQPQPQYSDSKYEGVITRKTISQPPNYNYAIRNPSITQGGTVEEIQKKLLENRPFIKERIDYKIQPPHTPVEIREIKLNTVPEPYIPQNFRHMENVKNIGNIDPIRQSHYTEQLPLRNLPQNLASSGYAIPIKIDDQRKRAAEILAIKEAGIARASAGTSALNAKEAQIARTITKPNLKQTNIYTPLKQYQDANLPSNYHQIRQLIQSNPKLQNVIASVKNKKRYLVVHPDGRVEHVDNLEPIIQKHPEHILVNASTLMNHVPKINPHTYPVDASKPNPPHVPVPIIPNAAPTVATAAAATATTVTGGPITNPARVPVPVTPNAAPTVTTAATATATAVTGGPIINSVLKPRISHEPVNKAPETSAVIKTPVTLSPTKTSTPPTAKLAVPAAPSSSSAVVASATSVPTIPSTPGVPIPPKTTTKDGTMNKLHAALTTKSVVHPPVISKPTPSARTHVNTLSVTAPHRTTSKASDIPTTTSKAPNSSVFSNSSSPIATPYQTTPIVNVTKSIPTKSATSSHSTATSDTDSSTSKVNSDSSVSTSSNVTIPKIDTDSAITDEPCLTVDESSTPVESCATAEIRDEVSSDVSDDITVFELDRLENQSVGEPVVWFEATDSDFWDQLLEDESYNVIYFINVPPQPIIEKDTKTTVFPNGTIVEEITETKRNRECDEPIVTKTVRLIEPKE